MRYRVFYCFLAATECQLRYRFLVAWVLTGDRSVVRLQKEIKETPAYGWGFLRFESNENGIEKQFQ